MPDQLELKPFAATPEDPNVKWLEDLLLGANCWMSSKDITLTTGGRLMDRDVRCLASGSEWILSGPGSPGYKHLKCCTQEEIRHYTEASISQGKQMIKRGLRLRRNAHRLLS